MQVTNSLSTDDPCAVPPHSRRPWLSFRAVCSHVFCWRDKSTSSHDCFNNVTEGIENFTAVLYLSEYTFSLGVRLNQNISAAIIYIEDNGESEGSHHWYAALPGIQVVHVLHCTCVALCVVRCVVLRCTYVFSYTNLGSLFSPTSVSSWNCYCEASRIHCPCQHLPTHCSPWAVSSSKSLPHWHKHSTCTQEPLSDGMWLTSDVSECFLTVNSSVCALVSEGAPPTVYGVMQLCPFITHVLTIVMVTLSHCWTICMLQYVIYCCHLFRTWLWKVYLT